MLKKRIKNGGFINKIGGFIRTADRFKGLRNPNGPATPARTALKLGVEKFHFNEKKSKIFWQ